MTSATFHEIVTIYRQQFEHGLVHLLSGERISDAVVRAKVPKQFGVYIITGVSAAQDEVLYIGKAGTIRQNGTYQKQTLCKRLRMKQEKEYRDILFPRWMDEMELRGLSIEYFITVDETHKVLPAYAEAELLQCYINEFGRLPCKNRTY